ncbi:hypothetical protein NMG60_11031992 [Bertholletia excelsa]
MDLAKSLSRSPPISASGGAPPHSASPGFPIIAVAVIGILATAFLLVSYYVFVIKCCLHWHRIDLLRRFSSSRPRTPAAHSPAAGDGLPRQGLDESVIRSIPTFHFRRKQRKHSRERNDFVRERSFSECAVCLNEFQEGEKLRAIPNCGHVFHVDCIDVWLQGNVNCPLCRTSISYPHFAPDHIAAPSPTPTNPDPNTSNLDPDYVVIELGEPNSTDQTLLQVQERLNSGELPIRPTVRTTKNLNHVLSMGDECIDLRKKDNQFGIVQPRRRSFSMDSASDGQLYQAVQEIIEKNRGRVGNMENIYTISEGCSSRVRSFFSFANGRGSKSTVLPIGLDPAS